MRIIFAGTPEFAAAHLDALLTGHDVVAVYTQPDRRAGRGKKLLASPVKQLALANGIAVEQPTSLKAGDEQQTLRRYCTEQGAELMVVAAYGMLLPQAVLDIPRHGCINVHASLLPRWRGAAPVERAIMAGDTETGITIMQMDAGLDTGAMLLKAGCAIDASETGDSLRGKLIDAGGPLLLSAVEQIEKGQLQPQGQDDSQATYARKLDKREAALDWREPAIVLERKIRAFTSALACYGILGEQRIRIASARAENTQEPVTTEAPGTIKLLQEYRAPGINEPCLRIRCGEGSLLVDRVQAPGGKVMSLSALLNGRPGFFVDGMCFASISGAG